MSKIIAAILVLLVASISAIYNGGPSGPAFFKFDGPLLVEPPVVQSVNGALNFTLTVDAHRYTGFISFNTRAFFYQNVACIPGPTWKVRAGDTVTVTLVNAMKPNTTPMPSSMNMFHHPNTTNIHTHGLHVDPTIDTVFIGVEPGATYTYKYVIPSYHAPGIHWYHSHKHGASALQVMGGLYGAIWVNGDELPSPLSTLTRKLLLFSHFSMDSINTSDDPFKVRTYAQFSTLTSSAIPISATYTNSSVNDIYFTNGQYQPYMSMTPGSSVVLDFVHASGDHFLEIEVRTGIKSGISACTMTLIALDGVYLTSSRVITYLVLIQAQRATIVLTCPNAGTYYLQSNADEVARPDVAGNEIRFNQNLLRIDVAGSSSTPITVPTSLTSITRPFYLQDLTSSAVASSWEVSIEQTNAPRDMAWLGIGTNCSFPCGGRGTVGVDCNPTTNLQCSYQVFPGELTSKGTYRHVGTVNTTEQLTVRGRGASPHVVHLHVNHVQIISSVSDNGPDPFLRHHGRYGDWRDTVPALQGAVVVKYRMASFTGEVILHCHFLFHEDMGMMGSIYSAPSNVLACTYPSTCTSTGATTPTTSTKKPVSAATQTVASFVLAAILLIAVLMI